MNVFSHSYLIKYDEHTKSIAVELPSGDRLFEISLTTLRQLGMQEASKFVGERILLLLPETRRVLTGLPASVDVEQIEDSIKRLRVKAVDGDSESLFRLGMLLISRATTVGSWSDIDEAELLLRLASEGGHVEASEFLAITWPDIKAGYLKRTPTN